MSAAEVVRARIDANLKREAATVLSGMGLSVSDAIRMMLVQVVSEGALPFEVKVPNRSTKAALTAAKKGEVARFDTVRALMADLNDN